MPINKRLSKLWMALFCYLQFQVVESQGAFWTCRGESAEILSEFLGYRLGGSDANPMTGSPNLVPITDGLRENRISYIVVEDGDIIEIL